MKQHVAAHVTGKGLIFCLLCLLAGLWAVPMPHGTAWAGEPSGAQQLKLMSTFLSNFTEVRLFDFDVERGGNDAVLHLGGDPSQPELIRFGIWHNYVNNFQSRIKPCPVKGCKYGSAVIDARYVAESIKKYFDIDVKHSSVDQPDAYFRCHFDGKRYHFEMADGDPAYHARVEQATQEGGVVRMIGHIYNPDDKAEATRAFVAIAKPHKWNGKNTWAILSLRTTEQEPGADVQYTKTAR